MIFFALTNATKTAIEMFVSGATAAISLYCGTKTPKNRRKQW